MIESTSPNAPVIMCFYYFPLFEIEYKLLREMEIIYCNGGNCSWNKSLTSLGEYFSEFKSIGECIKPVTGGFWNPVETAFNVKRGSLRHLASGNGRCFVREKSVDYENIMKTLGPRRELILQQKQAVKNYRRIKAIMNAPEPEKPEDVEKTLEIIKNVLA